MKAAHDKILEKTKRETRRVREQSLRGKGVLVFPFLCGGQERAFLLSLLFPPKRLKEKR